MKLKCFIFTLCILLSLIYTPAILSSRTEKIKVTADNYLSIPTGQYSVGFKDFHWINHHSYSNDCHQKNCRTIDVRIYYTINHQPYSKIPYNPVYMNAKKDEFLSQIPNIPKEQINQLNKVISYSTENTPIANGKKFPVLIFSPGGGCSSELYENFITELVSYGYIVVGINTQFTGDTKNDVDIEKKSVPYDAQVLVSVFKKIHSLHNSSTLFLSMDLNHIGLLGHSIGGRVLADIVHTHPTWFQAAATLDIGFDTTGKSKRKFDIPFLHLISASTLSESSRHIIFKLGKNNFLVVVSPNKENHSYSLHMNFTDLSTLQYLPAFQRSFTHLKQEATEPFDLKFMSHSPRKNEIRNFNKPTYVLVNQNNKWDIEYYKTKTDKTHSERGPYHFVGGINGIKGLSTRLASLKNNNIDSLSESEIKSIQRILETFQHNTLSKPLGSGSGWNITTSINIYLLQFFNMFLKDQKNTAFIKCLPLSKNTFIICGPNQVEN